MDARQRYRLICLSAFSNSASIRSKSSLLVRHDRELCVSTYVVEDEGGESLIEFSFDGLQLRERRIGLVPDDADGRPVSPEAGNGI